MATTNANEMDSATVRLGVSPHQESARRRGRGSSAVTNAIRSAFSKGAPVSQQDKQWIKAEQRELGNKLSLA